MALHKCVSTAALLCVLTNGAGAQDDLHSFDHEHTRHEHPHNHPHETEPAGTRFHTSRASDVVLDLPREDDAFFFVVFGDRTGGPDEGVAVLKDAVRDTNLLEPDLVMTVGDLIQGYNQTDDWMRQMREYKGVMDHLVCPWFPVAGNHDIYWRGPDKPAEEHEKHYEMHFGPLWYAFDHKNARFIALYSDEGNPETGERSISKPDAQVMSDEQLSWLRSVLDGAKDKDHVFVFLHHPRWRGANYGDDWEKVHELLAAAGNVSAVFAGHIHRMDYSSRDGIEYVTLATVGGHQQATVPDAGYLHHYNIVTVRKGSIGMTSIPVGAAIDPREITDELRAAAERFAGLEPRAERTIEMNSDGSADGLVELKLDNPTPFDVALTVSFQSGDSRWSFGPDHDHVTLAAGDSRILKARVARPAAGIDDSFRTAEVVIDAELLTSTFRYRVPTVRSALDLDASRLVERGFDDDASAGSARNGVLATRGADAAVSIADADIALPDGPFTLECWLNADEFGRRTGLVAKTQNSDYGIFVNNGKPHFSVFLDDAYASANAASTQLETGVWHHIAGVYDGSAVRLYVDGELVANNDASGTRRANELPLIVGGDVDASGRATSGFEGLIDDVRLSTGARYRGDRFTPPTMLESDANTVLLLNFDGSAGPWIFDRSPAHLRPMLRDGAAVVPAAR